MQAPPPIPNLLLRLETFAINVKVGLADQDEAKWQIRPFADQWSLTEIVCHMRDVEREVYNVRFKSILAEDNAFLSVASPDEWAVERGYAAQDGVKALSEFLVSRQETLDLLKSLTAELWQRQGQHAFFGPTTMHELVYLAVRHDDIHWEQIRNLLAAL
jgi:hypothetical protein